MLDVFGTECASLLPLNLISSDSPRQSDPPRPPVPQTRLDTPCISQNLASIRSPQIPRLSLVPRPHQFIILILMLFIYLFI